MRENWFWSFSGKATGTLVNILMLFLVVNCASAHALPRLEDPARYQVYSGDFPSIETGVDGYIDILLMPPPDVYLPLGLSPTTIIPLRSRLTEILLCGGADGLFYRCNYIGEAPGAEFLSSEFELLVEDFSGDIGLDLIIHSLNAQVNTIYLEKVDSEFQLKSQFSDVQGVLVSGAPLSVIPSSVVSNAMLEADGVAMEYANGQFSPAGVTPLATKIGAIPGQADASGGGFSYTIPLNVSPGSAGLTPSLSLGYSSDRGVGMAGVGFSLSGASSVTRCPKSNLFHGKNGRVSLSSSDVACLDGNELILESGAYWQDGSTYRGREEDFTRVTYHSGGVGGAGTFVAESKDGASSTYGGGGNSLGQSSSGIAFRWALSKVSDRVGNYYLVEYRDGTLAKVPERYRYTLNQSIPAISTEYASIELKYAGAEDLSTGFEYGASYTSGLRLERVINYVDGEVFREYLLHYEENPSTKNFRLSKLYECASGRQCLEPTLFSWEAGSSADYTSMTTWAVPSSWSLQFDTAFVFGATYRNWVDISGDGISDFCSIHGVGSSGDVVCFISDGSGAFSSMTRVPAQISGEGAFPSYGGSNENTSSWNKDPSWADIDTDGDIDLCFTGPLNGTNARCYLNSGDGSDFSQVSYPDISHNLPGGISRNMIASRQWLDINADGYTDHCVFYINYSGSKFIHCITGSSGAGFVAGPSFSQKVETLSPMFAFINGDSLPDLCWLSGSNLRCSENLNGESFSTAYWLRSNVETTDAYQYVSGGKNYGQTFADFNGDGLDDFCRIIDGSAGKRLGCVLSTGVAWGNDVQSPSIGDVLPHGQSWIDINDDGGVDWCRRESSVTGGNAGVLKCMTSHNGAFVESLEYPMQVPSDPMSVGFQLDRLDLVDVNGDGAIDLCSYYINAESLAKSICYRRPDSKLPDYLLEVENGQGLKYLVEYKSMLDPNIYSIDLPSDSPLGAQRYIKQPRQLVEKFGASDGAGGTTWRSYKYKNYSWDPAYGIGVFGYMSEENSDGDGVVERWYNTASVPAELAGKPVRRVEWAENSSGAMVKLAEENTVWNYKHRIAGNIFFPPPPFSPTVFNRSETSASAGYFAYIESSISETWDLDGGYIGKSETLNTFDNFGGLTDQITTRSNLGLGQSFTTVLSNTINNDVTAWSLGRIARSEMTYSGQYGGESIAPIKKVSAWEYYPESSPNGGMVWKEIIEPDSADLMRETEYSYNEFGLKSVVTETARAESRSAEVGYDSRGRYITDEWNDLRHHTTHQYNPVLAKRESSTGPNNLTVHWKYDALGRATETTAPNELVTHSRLYSCVLGCPAHAIYYSEVWTTSMVGVITSPSAREYYDLLGRVVERRQDVFAGKEVRVSYEYDGRGNLLKQSEPYFSGDTVYWSLIDSRDGKGRVLKQTGASGLIEEMSYSALGMATTISWQDPITGSLEVRNRSTLSDLLGRKRVATDEAGADVVFHYDALGNPISTDTDDGLTITQTFNVRGERQTIQDPDSGAWKYGYNGFGESVLQEDGQGMRTCSAYDQLGRKEAVTYNYAPSLTWAQALVGAQDGCSGQAASTSWVYDVPAKGVGRLAYIYHDGLLFQEIKYDALGRPYEIEKHLDGKTFVATNEYDQDTGRLVRTLYPQQFESQRFAIRFGYSAEGVLDTITNDSGSLAYWSLGETDARGNTLEQSFSGGTILSSRGFNSASGFLESVAVGGVLVSPTADNIADMQFKFDPFGNLRERKEQREDSGQSFAIQETFEYDIRSRLTDNTVSSVQNPALNYTDSVVYAASGNGNIASRSEVGTYQYGGSCTVNGNTVTAGPHAVTSVTGAVNRSICYDASGNMVSDGTKTIAYSPFNKPSLISGASGNAVALSYGPGRDLIKRVETTATQVSTKYLMGSYELLEEVEAGAAVSTARYYVGGNLVISVKDSSPASLDEEYLFHDHQGSLVATANAIGGVRSRFAFDAWGRRRDWQNWMMMSEASLWTIGQGTAVTERGYTGHEMLDSVGLVHMGGRVYDPTLGRFLTPDIHVQQPENYQNYNRYSYVLNRPTSLTDPSGYSWWSDNVTSKWRKVRNEVAAAVFPYIAAQYHSFDKGSKELARFAAKNEYAGEIISIVGIAGCSFFSAGMGAAACAGAFQGGVTTSIAYGSGQSLEQALGAGAQAGAVAFANSVVAQGIGDYTKGYSGYTSRSISGVMHATRGAVFSGGDYRSGALGGFVQGFLEGDVGKLVGNSSVVDMAQGAGLTGLIGGAAAYAGGGKFGSGATTAAFGYVMSYFQSTAQKGDDPHAGHTHTGPGGNPNPDGITQQQMIGGEGTWSVNHKDTYHQKGVDPDFPHTKYNDAYGHEEVFDHNGVPVRDHNGPTFNRHNGNLNPLHLIDIIDWKVNGTGWSNDKTTSSDRCVIINC